MNNKIREPERAIQKAVFDHFRERAAPGVFAFHPINGGVHQIGKRRGINSGQGVVSGVPDVVILRAGTCYMLELKKLGGKLSAIQIACHEKLKTAGVIVHTAYGLSDALAWLEQYSFLKGKAA